MQIDQLNDDSSGHTMQDEVPNDKCNNKGDLQKRDNRSIVTV